MASYPVTTEIALEHSPGWLTVWLDRPQVRNALSETMASELRAVAETARSDTALRGLTLRGRGGVFCAGADIKRFASILEGNATIADVAAYSRHAGELFHLINELPQVVVALVEGAALAGGLGLACAADVVAATEDARFALTETMIGIPPAQITPFIVQRVGPAAARRIMLTGTRLDVTAARELGLVDFVAADADGLATIEAEVRRGVMACAPGANAATKEIILAMRKLEGRAMIDFAADRFAACMLGDEGREGTTAFFEKRKPRWAQ
jgi:isohexenylglutaconyl-CoA hydratase